MTVGFLDVLITVMSLVILIVPGYLLSKTKVLGEKADAALSALVLYGCQPMLCFMSFQKTAYSPTIGLNMLIVAGLAIVIHLIMIGLIYLIVPNKDNQAKLNCLRFASVFSNCGYMGFPFLESLFGGDPATSSEILIYGGIIIAIFNVLNWSVGVYMMTGDKKNMSIKKAVLNPVVIAIIIGLILFFTVQRPIVDLAAADTVLDNVLTKLMKSLASVGDMVTPLSMIVIGVKLANVNLKSLIVDKWAYYNSFIKLIIMSFVTMLCVAFLPIDTIVKYALFFCLSMPSATGTVLFAVRFGGDSMSAPIFVLQSTVLSILTIPLMFLIFSGVFGVVI
ncbi:MAG: hypothetical protein E7369_02370 [Clostridiales bacterium]|nr:hypothetical protein [Clostridiales bacterium]